MIAKNCIKILILKFERSVFEILAQMKILVSIKLHSKALTFYEQSLRLGSKFYEELMRQKIAGGSHSPLQKTPKIRLILVIGHIDLDPP